MATTRSSGSSGSKNGKKRSSSNKKRYNNVFLPDELMFQIFALLPVITLLRCKSVCKSWLSIILNPKFIEAHLIESRKRQPLSLLKTTSDQFYIDTDHETSSLLQLPKHLINMIRLSGCLSCCNGLVCLTNRNCDVIYLWNPMTRQFKKLPTPQNKTAQFGWCVLGFGYDDVCDDYKILRIVFKRVYNRNNTRGYDSLMVVEMYSANEDSWKAIEVPKTVEYFSFYRYKLGLILPQTPRVLYFEGFNELLSFDLHDEVFRVYPFPILGMHPISGQKKRIRRMSKLLNFEGSLAMIYQESIDDGESVYTLWTLDIGDCGNASWSTNQFNLDNSLKNDQVELYLGDGQFVAAENFPYVPFFYYYKEKLAKKFLLPAPPGALVKVVKYNESLVSVKGFEKVKW